MYYLGLLLFLCSSVLAAIPYSEKDASIVGVYGSETGAFLITAGDVLQFYWSSQDGTIENCTAPSSLAVSTVMYDVQVEGDNLSILLLSNNRLYIVTFVVTVSGDQHICNGTSDWTDKLMKGKPMWAYFLPEPTNIEYEKLFAYSDTKRNITVASYTRVSGQISVGWSQAQSLIDVDAAVGIANGPVNDYAQPAFFYDSAQDAVIYLDKSGKIYICDLTVARASNYVPTNFTQIVYDPTTLGVIQVLGLWVEPALASLMINVGTSTCNSAVIVIGYNAKDTSPSPVVFSTIDKDCTTRLPLSDSLNFYYQSVKQVWKVDGASSSVYFTAVNGTVVDDYKFFSSGKALVITKNQNTLVCSMFLVDGGQVSPFTAIPFLASDIFEWRVVFDSTGSVRGVLFWTTVATIYGYGFGDTTNEVTLALDNPKEFTVINLQAENAGINDSKSYMAIAEGSDEGVEYLTPIFWDYSTLALPLQNDTVKPAFYFPDFIIALTRVKNDVTTIFSSFLDSGDVTSIESWSPDEWKPYPDGLRLTVTFTQGETDDKINTILTSMANEIGVTVERECEFQDFLSCDVLTLWQVYEPDAPTSSTVGAVTFYVNGVASSLPSVLAFLVTVLYTLVSL